MLGYSNQQGHRGKGADEKPPWYASRAQREKADGQVQSPGALPTLAEVARCGFLLELYEKMKHGKGQAPGPDGLRYGDFSRSEIAQAARALEECILDGTYRPYPHR